MKFDTRLYFLHIPRTGGTTLINLLAGLTGPGQRVCPAHEMHEFEELDNQGALKEYNVYLGHFGFNLFDKIGNAGFKLTLLRQPVDRVISTWRHLNDTPLPFQNSIGEMVEAIKSDTRLAKELDFPGFCDAILGQGRLSFFNQACVLLGHGRGFDLTKQGIPRVDDALLERAKENIGRFDFVGITEHYSDSVKRLNRVLETDIRTVHRENPAVFQMPELDDAFAQKLKMLTSWDQALYDFALDRFLNELH